MSRLDESAYSPKICIIGAGPCGITAVKNLVEQGLTHLTVFEKNKCLGGNWVFDEANEHSSVYETTHLISSKRLSEYEDFAMPNDYPDYPSHRQLLDYFKKYAAHFSVEKFIKYNSCVERAELNENNQWQVTYRDEQGQHEAIYDYLLVANGHHWDPLLPQYPGYFEGELMHSHQYKKAEPFKNKRVLVVGAGNSACDIAVEISRIAKKTSISIRRGQHIFPKFIFGKPTDLAFAKIKWLPFWLQQRFASITMRIIQGRYTKYQLKKPNSKPLAKHPTINSELLYFIRHGKIKPKPGIDRFENKTVYFADGSFEEFDNLIFATGYKISFPFFDPDFLDYSELMQVPLYRKMMHSDHENLYFIGLFQPQGCIWPLADYQAKIAAKIIAKKLERPKNLKAKIEKEIKVAQNLYLESRRHALEVDYHQFRRQLLNELKRDKR